MASLTISGLLKTPLYYSQALANHRQYPPSAFGQHQIPVSLNRALPRQSIRASASNSGPSTSSSPGLYSAQKFELTIANVDLVLEDVRPYLIADGGNVDVVSVEDGIVSLKLVGACGSCPSSTTTMKMGIERVLKEKFGDSVKEICQVYDEEPKEITTEAVNSHLDILRPAIRNYGGSVEVISIDGGNCVVMYEGPESIGTGIKAAIKEKFPDITNVVFSS
ncbi:nifU-like protein 1, chloroplastic [Cucurbita maxima]|uniref:NifU-like protein 1, chloroplastic n=1 Tax=Cucurbita maxima TaxID=3661 RepID=A0A6J1JN01_CUCMA|nr:nifU-like protein 1, chloroplastic [Cucurbita maxima]